jgi:UDP-galactopyranose mutase
LVRRQVPVTVLEGDSMVGGISRTAEREGWRFDIGGHRFFTKVPEVRRSGTRSSPTRTSCSARG